MNTNDVRKMSYVLRTLNFYYINNSWVEIYLQKKKNSTIRRKRCHIKYVTYFSFGEI